MVWRMPAPTGSISRLTWTSSGGDCVARNLCAKAAIGVGSLRTAPWAATAGTCGSLYSTGKTPDVEVFLASALDRWVPQQRAKEFSPAPILTRRNVVMSFGDSP